MHRVFAYGTLLNSARQKSLFGRRIPHVPAVVAGWRKLVCVGPYYGIVRERGARTEGGVLELTRAELTAADDWEGVPSSYRRTRVRVAIAGRSCLCWAYVPAQGRRAGKPL
jgi:acyl-CoA thioesterase I